MKPPFKVETIDSFPWGVIGWKDDHSMLYANAAARSIFNLIGDDQIVFLQDIAWVNLYGESLSPENHPVALCFEKGEKVSGIVIGFSLPSETQITWIEAHCIPEFEEGNPRPVQVVFTFSQTATQPDANNRILSDETKVITVREEKSIFESDILNHIGQAVILTENEKSYRSLFETNPEPMWIFDVETLQFLDVNHAAVEHYGYSREEFLNMTLKDIRPEEDVPKLVEYIQGSVKVLNRSDRWQHKKKNGEVIDVEILSHTIDYHGRKAKHILANDVTEKQKALKELEISEVRFRKLFENMTQGVIYQDLNGVILSANAAAQQILGLTFDQILGRTSFNPNWKVIKEDGSELTKKEDPSLMALRTGKEIRNLTIGVKSPEMGDYVWLLVNAVPEFKDGETEPYRVFTTLNDITLRKKAEDQFRESEEKYRTLLSSMDQGFCIIEKIASTDDQPVDFRYIEANPAFEHHTGLINVVGKTIREVVPDAEQAIFDIYDEVVQTGKHYQFESYIASLDFWIEAEVIPTEKPNQIAVLFSNISDRKNAEESLRSGEMLLNEMGRIARIGAWELDCSSMKQVWTDETFAIHDRELGIYDPNSTEELSRFEQGSKELIEKAFEVALTQGKPYDLEVEMTTLKGNRKWVRAVCSPVLTAGKVIKLTGTVQDITARKQAEKVLRESENRFSTLFKLNPSPVGITSTPDYRIVDVNEAWCRLTGYKREEVLGRTTTELALTDSGTLKQIRDVLKEDNKVSPFEITLITRSGQERQVVMSSEQVELGGEFFFINTLSDITELKLADRNRSIALTKYKTLFDNFPAGITVSDKAGNIIETNSTAGKILGVSAEEQMQRQISGEEWKIIRADGSLMPSAEYPSVRALKEGQKVENVEMGIVKPDKSVIWINVTAAPIPLDEYGVVVTYKDISERKLSEKRFYENQALLKQVLESGPDAIFAVDLNYRLLISNKQYQRLLLETGGNQIEVGENTINSKYQPEVIEMWCGFYNRAFRGEDFMVELEFPYSDGLLYTKEIHFSPLSKNTDEIIGALVESHDITERKKVQVTLEENERRLRKTIETTSDGFWIVDSSRRFIEVNDAYCKMSGYTRQELISMNISDIEAIEVTEDTNVRIQKIIKDGGDRFETVHRRKDGSLFDVEVSVNLLDQEDGLMICFCRDISERKQAEKQLRESEKRFSTIFEDSPVAIAISRLNDGKIIMANSSIVELLGYTPNELIGHTTVQLGIWTNPADRQHFIESLSNEQRVEGMEATLKVKSGEERQVMIWGELIELAGEPCMMVMATDITDNKKSEQRLREREAELNEAQVLAKMANWRINISDYQLSVSDNYRRLIGIEDDSFNITLEYFISRVHPDDVYLMKPESYQTPLDSTPVTTDFRIRMDDGSYRWFLNSMVGEISDGNLVAIKGTIIDLTDKKKQEEEIKAQNQKLSAILNALPDKLFIHDSQGTFVEAYTTNPSGFIVPVVQFIGKNLYDIFPEEVANLNLKYLQECLNSKELITHEFSVDYKGKYSHFEVRVVPFMEDKVIRFVRDITEKKNQEEEIRSQNQKLNAILNALPDRLFVHDSEGNYLEAYTTDPSGFIMTMDNFIGKNIRDVLPKDVAETNLKYLQECLEKKEILMHELSFDYNGTYSHFEVRVVPLMKDKVIRFVRDITQTKENEKQIIKLNKAIEQSPVAIVITDINAKITYVSLAFEEITGYTKDEVIGENTRILKSGKNRKELYTEMWETIKSGEIWEGELINKKKDGTFYWEHLSITPLYENDVQITGYLAVKQDITEKKKIEQEILDLNTSLERKVEDRTLELKQANEELIKAKETADEANKAKSIFLANMSHEIRTPLNSIIGFSELLANSSIDEKKRSQVDSIRNSGRSLLNIINDILDLSKVEAGKIVIEREPLNVFKIVSDVSSMFEYKAFEKKLDLTIESETDLTTPLMLDETRLRQILFNIMGNAIKFTPKGSVSVFIHHEEKEDNRVDLKIRIADTGIGIPQDQLSAIFEPFVQQQGQAQKIFGGTGLGLAISRRMAEAMGGEILVNSKMNEGSEFIVYLKNVSKADSHPEKEENNTAFYSNIRLDGNTILIVDDVSDNRKLLWDVLEPTGAHLLEAKNGEQAVQIATKEKPDIILMDIRMPVMDGVEACKTLKQSPITADIPCIAVTASIKLGRSGKEIPENFEDCLMKPVAFDQLFELLLKYLKHATRPGQSTSQRTDFPYEAERDWSDDLKQYAEKELTPLYNHVMRTQLVDEIEDFGKQLVSTGNKFNDDLLINIGNKLGEYADLFDVDKLSQTMHEFQFILNRKLNT